MSNLPTVLEVELSSVTFFAGCRALFMCIVSGALTGQP